MTEEQMGFEGEGSGLPHEPEASAPEASTEQELIQDWAEQGSPTERARYESQAAELSAAAERARQQARVLDETEASPEDKKGLVTQRWRLLALAQSLDAAAVAVGKTVEIAGDMTSQS